MIQERGLMTKEPTEERGPQARRRWNRWGRDSGGARRTSGKSPCGYFAESRWRLSLASWALRATRVCSCGFLGDPRRPRHFSGRGVSRYRKKISGRSRIWVPRFRRFREGRRAPAAGPGRTPRKPSRAGRFPGRMSR